MDTTRTIVIIDDDEDDRELMQSIFNTAGYENEVRFFASAEEAWGFLSKPCNPLLILSDGQMPRMTGYELWEKAKAVPYLQHVPFVFLTTSEHYHATLPPNSQGYFSKPTSFEELQKTLMLIIDYWANNISSKK